MRKLPFAVAILLLLVGCNKANRIATSQSQNVIRDGLPADHSLDSNGFVARDLAHGNNAFRLELNRQWRGTATLNTRFGPGWSDQNDFRLLMLTPKLVVIERGGVGWREAYRKDDKTFEGIEGDKILRTDQGWTAQMPPGFTYTFNSKGRLTNVKPPAGPARSYVYDDKGRLTVVGTGPENVLQYEYSKQNRVTTVRGPEGLRVTYEYDNKGRLASVVTARAYRIQYGYTADGKLSMAQDQLGSALSLSQLSATVPLSAKPTEQLGATVQQTAKYQFDAQGRPTAVIEDGSTKNYKYGGSGSLTEISDGKKRSTCKYDAFGRITAVQAADGSSMRFEYNNLDQPTLITKADGTIERLKYDEHGRTTRLERLPLDWEELSYDNAGRIAARKIPPSAEAHYSYEDGDRVSRIKYSSGRELSFRYDSDGNAVSESSSTGESRSWRYDANGRLIESVSPAGLKTTYVYDRAGKLIRKEDPVHGKTTYSSTPKGEVEESALGKTRTRSTEWGKPIEIVAPGGTRTAFAYDAGGLLQSVLSPSNVPWRYEHDSSGKLTALIAPSGLRTLLSWDPAGRQTKVVRGDITCREYRYDRNGAWREEYSANGRAARYNYGSDRQLASLELPNGKVTFASENAGLRWRETAPSYGIEDERHPDGMLLRRNYTASKLAINLPLDAVGRPVGVELNDLKATYAYDGRGQIQQIRLPSGSSIDVGIDQAGRPAQITFSNSLVENIIYDRADRVTGIEARQKSGKALFKETYQFDAAGNLTSRNTDGIAFKFQYDRDSRLVEASSPNATRKFAYDVDGNLSSDGEGKQRCHIDKLGRPTERETIAYSWDKAGNLTQIRVPKGKIDNVFDSAGRLTMRRDDKKTWRYAYDAENNRLSEDGPAGKRAFAYLDDRLAGFKDEAGTTWLIVYLPGTDKPIALCGSNRQTLFVVSDQIGSARRFVDEKGNVIATNDYTVFGNVIAAKGKPPISIYAGMVRDETGLIYARQRYYDPTIARFISIDPLIGIPGNPASHNAYAYAANNPLRYRDPMGTGFYFDVEKLWYRPDMDQHLYDSLSAEEKAAVRSNYDAVSQARRTMQNPTSSPSEVQAAKQSLAAHDAALDRLNQIGKLRYQHKIATVAELDDFHGQGVYSAEGAARNSQMIADSEAKLKAMGVDPLAGYTEAGKERIAQNAAQKANPAAAQKAAEEAAAAQKAAEEAALAERDAKAAGAFKRGTETGAASNVKVEDPNATGGAARSTSANSGANAGEGVAQGGAEAAATKTQAELAASAREKIQRSLQTNEQISVSKEEMDAYDAEEAAKRAGQSNNALVAQNGNNANTAGGTAGAAGENVGDTSGVHDPGILKDGSPRDIDMQKNANGVWERKPPKTNSGDASHLSDADEPYRPGVDGQRPPPKGDIDMKFDPADGVLKPVGGGAGIVGEGGEAGERWLGPMIIEQGGKVLKWLKPIGEVAGPIAELIGTADLAAKMANNFIDTLNEPFMKEKRERDAAKWAEGKYKEQLAQLAAGDPDNIATRDGHKFDPKNPSDMEDLMSDLSDNLYWGHTPYNGLFKNGKISKKAASAPTSFMSADSGDTAAPTALADAWKKMQTAIEKEKSASEIAKECIRQQEEAKSQLESAVKACGARGYLESDISQLPVAADDVKKQTEAVKNQTKTLNQAFTDMGAAIDKTDDTSIKVCQWANEAASGATAEKIAELRTKATNELQSATDTLNNAQAKLDGADFAIDQLTESKAKLEGFRTGLQLFKMGNGVADAVRPDDMLKAANTAAKAASDARSKLNSLVSDVKSLGSEVVGMIAPFVSSDPEAAALSAAAQNLGNDIPDVGMFDFGMLMSLASPVVNGFIANQKSVDDAIGKVDIDALVSAANDVLQAADSARSSAKTLATGPDRYRGLQNASTCFSMMGSATPNNTAQTSTDTGGSDQSMAPVPAVDKIDTAESVITAAGFTPNIVGLAPQAKDQEFKLAGQNPGPGEMLARGQPVTVYFYQSYGDTVSPTPTPMVVAANSPNPSSNASASPSDQGPTVMPKLTGLTLDQATTRLGKHMRIGSDEVGSKPPSPEKGMTIYLQTPAAGSKIDPDKELVVSVKRYGSAKVDAPSLPPPPTGGNPLDQVMNEIDKKYQHYYVDFNAAGQQLGKRLAMQSWQFSIRNRKDGNKDYFYGSKLARVVSGSGNNLSLTVTEGKETTNFTVEISDNSVRMTTDVSVVVMSKDGGRSHWETQRATITLPRSNEHFGLQMEGQYPESPEEIKRLQAIFGKQ